MWRQKAQRTVPRVLAGAAAAVLTVAAFLYVPIALASAAQGPAMAVRTRLVLVVLILSATSTWLLAIRPTGPVGRFATNGSTGFNLIWIFSFAGLPIVGASLLAAVVATVAAPRRLLPELVASAFVGLGLGLLLLILTEPPGEHLFG